MKPVWIATCAAALASLGDLLLLAVAGSEHLAPGAAQTRLWLGGVLGVVGIPLYALGYRAASTFLVASPKAAVVVLVCGLVVGVVGAVIHGLTALHIALDLRAGATARDALASVLGWGTGLLALWGLAALAALVASIVFARLVAAGRTPAPRVLALANPALLTLVLAVVGLSAGSLRDFLTPAAPNLAHLVFFAACGWLLRTGPGRH